MLVNALLTWASEKLMEAWYYCNHYCGTTVTCRYAIPEELAAPERQPQLAESIEQAICRAVLEHPLLQVGLLARKAKKLAYLALDSIDLAFHIHWQHVEASEDYEATLQADLLRQRDEKFWDLEKRPGWKITVFRPAGSPFIDIVLLFCHSMGDGVGGRIFHESLIRILNTTTFTDAAPDIQGHVLRLQPQPPEYYPPPLHKMCRLTLTKRYTVAAAWEALRPPFLVGKSETQATWMPFKPGPAVTRSKTLLFAGETVASVLRACRAHGTTFTAMLQGIILVSLARQVRAEDAPAFRGNTAIDLRRFMPPKAPRTGREQDASKLFANAVTEMNHDYSSDLIADIRRRTQAVSEGDNLGEIEAMVWTVAAQVHGELRARIDLGLKNQVITLTKFVGDWREELDKWTKKPREVSLHVSNIMVIDGGDGPWRIERATFSMSAETAGPVLALSVISVRGGEMVVEVTWQAGTVEDAVGERMAREVEEWVNVLARE